MRNLLFVIVIFTLFLLMACTGNLATPLPTNADEATSSFTATLSATSSPFPISTETLLPTQTTTSTATLVSTQTTSPTGLWLIYPPTNQKEQPQVFYQLEFKTSQWEIVNDSSVSLYGTIRNEQLLVNKDSIGCAIIHTVGADNLSSYPREQFVFLFSQTPINFDDSYYNVFIVANSQDCLASGKQVLATLKKISIETVTPTP